MLVLLAPLQTMQPSMPPPLSTVMGRGAQGSDGQGALSIFDVEVRIGKDILWAGPMRVSDRAPASFSRQQSGAAPPACAVNQTAFDNVERTSLNVFLLPRRREANSNDVEVRVTWERPSDTGDCQRRGSRRTVGIEDAVTIEPGHEQTITGDGDLTIRIRRR